MTQLLMDKTRPNRVAGAVGFNVRDGNFYVFQYRGESCGVTDLGSDRPQIDETEYQGLKTVIYQPMENYEIGRNEIVAGTVSPTMLKEDLAHLGAEHMHQLQRAWELHHRVLASESVLTTE